MALYPSARATFSGNSFVENTLQVVSRGQGAGRAEWNEPGMGNYWSTYRGFDADGDGIGDVPHTEGGGMEAAVGRAPVLAALASGPALRFIRAVEDRWLEHHPVAIDSWPLVRPHSPPPPPGTPACLPA